ncbi:protein maelstrom 1-like [Rhopalosiphum maidis]|uniref:protein maelstrom 1-like n=1 Tax=Rhopalosiphum maidis TaxID=43146 RepID=UPI000EFEFA87|nr:protein maelstrom 1-like [Rhopalosiphum maidis]
MATKKNAFYIFLTDYRNEEINKGNKPSSFQQLSNKLAPIWNSMTDEEKNKYKVLARKNNSNQDNEKPFTKISDLRNNSNDFSNMQKYLTKMFEFIPNDKELFEKKFILLHINCHTHNGEQYYFPAEIAAVEFNLINGVSRTYHKIIGISKIYPRGFAGGMREYSDLFHQIYCWHEHPDDYQNILLEFLTFLKDGQINHTDFQNGTLDLPYLYTAETEIGMDIMKTKSSLERLYSTVFPKDDAKHYKPIFKIGSINQLLLEIKKKINVHLDPQNIRPGMSVQDILESDMFGHGLGCTYHEMKDIAFKCSKARVIQWMSNICKHVSTYTSLQIVPGRHIAAQLKDGSKMIIENANLPFTKQDLKLIDINTPKDDIILSNCIKSSILAQTQQDSCSSDEENNLY